MNEYTPPCGRAICISNEEYKEMLNETSLYVDGDGITTQVK